MPRDTDLLQEFAVSRDESAFRRMVRRYAPMVYGVGLRGTQNHALAEEITQTVFTILARKAPGLKPVELGGWLHRTAALETRNVSRKEQRRAKALSAMKDAMIPETHADAAWEKLSPHLDQAMTELPPADRHLVVLRFFEERSHREIAEATGRPWAGRPKNFHWNRILPCKPARPR